MNAGDVALRASNLLLGTAVGAGINESVFVMPRWFESPPQSLQLIRDRSPAKFWIPLQASAAAALGSAFALNRHAPARRGLLALALGLYVGTWAVTGAWFAPEIIRLSRAGQELPPDEIERRGRRWLRLSWIRHAALMAAWAATAAALGRRRPALALGARRAQRRVAAFVC
jgi:hypothetical protein